MADFSGHGKRFGLKFLHPPEILMYACSARPCSKHWDCKGEPDKVHSSGTNGGGRLNRETQRVTQSYGLALGWASASLTEPEGDSARVSRPPSGPASGPPRLPAARGSHPVAPLVSRLRLERRGYGRGVGGEGVYDATSDARRNWPPFASAEGPEVEAAVAAAQSGGKEGGRDPESQSRSHSGGNSREPL